MMEEELVLFLTDFLVKTLKLVIRELGLDVHPELKNEYFKNYHPLVYLAQTKDSELREKAEKAADPLELQFEYRFTGYGTLETVMSIATIKIYSKAISIYWRDIPSQVIVKKGRKSAKIQLSNGFRLPSTKQQCEREGRGVRSIWMTGAEIIPNGDDLEKEAGEAAERYEAEYSDERLSLLARPGIDQEQ